MMSIVATPGVFVIRCRLNARIYLGCSGNMAVRVRDDIDQLQNGEHHNIQLQEDWNRYSGSAFDMWAVERTSPPTDPHAVKRWYLSKYPGWMYNFRDGTTKQAQPSVAPPNFDNYLILIAALRDWQIAKETRLNLRRRRLRYPPEPAD